jgi:hypothetical protein
VDTEGFNAVEDAEQRRLILNPAGKDRLTLASRNLQLAEVRQDAVAQLAPNMKVVLFRLACAIHALTFALLEVNAHHPNRMND